MRESVVCLELETKDSQVVCVSFLSTGVVSSIKQEARGCQPVFFDSTVLPQLELGTSYCTNNNNIVRLRH